MSKWANHHELEKKSHQQVTNYLGEINFDGDVLTESCTYNNDVSNENTATVERISDDSNDAILNSITLANSIARTTPIASTPQDHIESDLSSDSMRSNEVEGGRGCEYNTRQLKYNK